MDYEVLIRFLLAALWGGMVGAEREYRNKSAGFRTMIMISIGSCLFTMLSVLIGGAGNPDRIASTIVTGIGFLGAGVIFRGENRINGITTAATIWAVAAVGMGIGAGYYFASASASIFILVVLAVLPYAERTIDQYNQMKVYTIQYALSAGKKDEYIQLMSQHHLKFTVMKLVKEGADLSVTYQVQGRRKNHEKFIEIMLNDNSIQRFEY